MVNFTFSEATTDFVVGDVTVANGLAWTQSGGEILHIEATTTKGDGRLLLTGQLGDVMKESAQTAMSYVRTRAKAFGIPDLPWA